MTSREHQSQINFNIDTGVYGKDPFWDKWIGTYLKPPRGRAIPERLRFSVKTGLGQEVQLSLAKRTKYDWQELYLTQQCQTCPLYVPPQELETNRAQLLKMNVTLPTALRGGCLFGRQNSQVDGPIVPKSLVLNNRRANLPACPKSAEDRKARTQTLT